MQVSLMLSPQSMILKVLYCVDDAHARLANHVLHSSLKQLCHCCCSLNESIRLVMRAVRIQRVADNIKRPPEQCAIRSGSRCVQPPGLL